MSDAWLWAGAIVFIIVGAVLIDVVNDIYATVFGSIFVAAGSIVCIVLFIIAVATR